MKQDLLNIIKHYGLRNQLKKLSEEVYEFQEAILMDDGSEESLNHIIEEYSDIQVILEQFLNFYELDITKIIETKVKKTARTLRRIEDEK